MKKIITTVSAMTLTMQAGNANSNEKPTEGFSMDELEFIYADDASFKGSGFVNLSVDKSVVLSNDVDGSGDVTLGDELQYTIQVTNLDNVEASDIYLLDLLESKIVLNVGTVAVNQGMVLSGNEPGDDVDIVEIDFGTIAPNWFALANFDVTVNNLQPGLNVIVNSAEVYGPSGAFFVSDDPNTSVPDPTMIDAYGALPDLIFSQGFEFSGSGGF